MKKLLSCCCVLGSLFCTADAQSVTPAIVNTTGGTNMFTFYRFEWSFGEAAAIETLSSTSPNLYVTNGVLQPGTHNPATHITTQAWAKEEIKVLPNPVKDVLEIDFFCKQQGKVTMNMIDAAGRLIGTRQFDYYGTGRIEKWTMGPFPSTVYFLQILLTPFSGSIYKSGSFKIVKIN